MTNLNRHPRKKTEPKTDMQNGHHHQRGSGKYGRWAACGCGISLIPLRLGTVIPNRVWATFIPFTQVSRYQKGKSIWILLKQETVSCSGISWTICKSAPHSRQITMPALPTVPCGSPWPSFPIHHWMIHLPLPPSIFGLDTGNKSVQKIIINNTTNLFFLNCSHQHFGNFKP